MYVDVRADYKFKNRNLHLQSLSSLPKGGSNSLQHVHVVFPMKQHLEIQVYHI